MDILITSSYKTMTFQHYLQQPKGMLEWTLLKKINNHNVLEVYSNVLKYINAFDNVEDVFKKHNEQYFLDEGIL